MANSIIALYDDMSTAEKVVRELREAGIPDRDISLVAHNAEGDMQSGSTTTSRSGKSDEGGSGAATGAGIGAAVGGIGGLLVGLGALAIPGIGPVLAAGPLAAAISGLVGAGVGAVAGGAAGGLIGGLVDMGVPEEQAQYFSEGVRRGGALVTVSLEDGNTDEVRDIMNRNNPVDINERAEAWRQSGWKGYDAKAKPYTNQQAVQERQTYQQRNIDKGGEVALPVMEEQLKVGKRQVQRGGVQVHTRVTEKPVEENVQLRQERVSVERRPVDRPVDANTMETFQEGTMEVTEAGEEAVVGKQARVVEEVVVRKDVEERTETVRDNVRRTDVQVDQMGAGGTSQTSQTSQTSGDTESMGHRSHYQSTYGQSGYQYEHYAPAYQYGASLRAYEPYRGWDWERVEPEARRVWEERNPGTWESIKDAVRHAWGEVKEKSRD